MRSKPNSVFDRLLSKQKKRCAACGRKHEQPRSFIIELDPRTGVARGLLCLGCVNIVRVFRGVESYEQAKTYARKQGMNKVLAYLEAAHDLVYAP